MCAFNILFSSSVLLLIFYFEKFQPFRRINTDRIVWREGRGVRERANPNMAKY